MSRTMSPGNFLEPVKSTGVLASRTARRGFYSLDAATYFVEINTQTSGVISIQPQWDTNLHGTITIESTEADAQDAPVTYNTADGTWIQRQPVTTSGDVAIYGTGATESNLTITLAGGGAGGAAINLVHVGACRLRLRLTISNAGTFRVAHSGKV